MRIQFLVIFLSFKKKKTGKDQMAVRAVSISGYSMTSPKMASVGYKEETYSAY